MSASVLFNNFINAVKEGKSLLTSEEGVFTTNNIQGILDCFVNNPIGSVENYNKRVNKNEVIPENDPDYKAFKYFGNNEPSFSQKIKKQFENVNESKVKVLFSDLLWLRHLPISNSNIGVERKKENISILIANLDLKNKIPSGIASYGIQKQNIYDDMFYLCNLFNDVLNPEYNVKGIENPTIEQKILDYCINYQEKIETRDRTDWNVVDKKKYNKSCLIHNMLLHLCDCNNFEPIAAHGTKDKIVTAFKCLITEKPEQTLDQKIKLIKKEIMGKTENKMQSFFDEQLQEIYNDKVGNTGFSTLSALKYKKAIVLYGPPGTSKTYSAKKLAKQLIVQDLLNGENFNHYFPDLTKKGILQNYLQHIYNVNISQSNITTNDLTTKLKENIHYLQLHPNYSYEDFIWGYQIDKEKGTITKKGKLLQIISEINKNKNSKQKHVLILDEINRIDLSKLFGEFFSGIENREEEIELSVEIEGSKSIKIPENLYIIGTMNEIDFSLERLDFALRRRFVWFEHNFDKDALKEIINFKISEYQKKNNNFNPQNTDIESYIQRCESLNDAISKNNELGNNYKIGHTFFAEIINIISSIKDEESKNIKLTSERALKILWNISIKPMLEAYLGKIEKIDIEKLLEKTKDGNDANNFADIFIGKAKVEPSSDENEDDKSNETEVDED